MPRQQISKATQFENIFNSTRDRVYAFSKKILRDDSLVQDCMQQCYMKLWEVLDTIDTEKEIIPLLYTYARNTCIDHLRMNARFLWTDELDSVSEKLRSDNEGSIRIREKETAREVEDILKLISPRRRQVFKLIRLQGFSYREVADYLNISVSTVEKHMHEAMKSLPKEIIIRLLVCLFLAG